MQLAFNIVALCGMLIFLIHECFRKPKRRLFITGYLLIILSIIVGYISVKSKDKKYQADLNTKEEKMQQLEANINDKEEKIKEIETDLNLKEQEINELKGEVKKTSLGISKIYEFNGILHETVAGKIKVSDDKLGVFQYMQELIANGNLPEFINVCEKQIEETPDWPTPYYYRGIANYNLGFENKANHYFKVFLEIATGNPYYEVQIEHVKKIMGSEK